MIKPEDLHIEIGGVKLEGFIDGNEEIKILRPGASDKPKIEEHLIPILNSEGLLPKYVWPGGYPVFYMDTGSNILCPDCANESGFDDPINAYDVNWEDESMLCDGCGEQIEVAYTKD